MSITKDDKRRIIGEYRWDESDSGSPEVQVAVLTHRINALTEHLRTAKKDHAGRRGLLQLVSKRRRHLNYLARTAPETYQSLVQRLGLRK
ncbi:MAG TPA: 30S ribosomal protein S15 [Planctomycetaceae bacterium]